MATIKRSQTYFKFHHFYTYVINTPSPSDIDMIYVVRSSDIQTFITNFFFHYWKHNGEKVHKEIIFGLEDNQSSISSIS